MKKELFNQGWKFVLGAETYAGLFMAGFQTNAPRKIQLPHDFVIEGDVFEDAPAGRAAGFYRGGTGFYTNVLHLENDMPGTIMLQFDGVYRNCEVFVNGCFAGEHKYGYSPFFVDITELVVPGDNQIKVSVDTLPDPNARWYGGGGIFRDVHVLSGSVRHIAPYGIWTNTADLSENAAAVEVHTLLEGKMEEKEKLRLTVWNPDGTKIMSKECFIHALHPEQTDTVLAIEDPRVWSPDDPALYEMQAELIVDGMVIDTYRTSFGIRTLELDAAHGLRINGKEIKLHGGCVHHDNGVIGSVSVYDAEARRVKKLKAAGYNAIRTAHNPPSSALLEACDRYGLLVMDEAFDMWQVAKGTYDYHRDYTAHWREDLSAMITRDRNHPSVILWSIGNEINEMSTWHGVELMKDMVDETHRLDPGRPVLVAGVGTEKWSAEDRALAVKKFGERDRSLTDISGDLEAVFRTSIDPDVTKAIADYTGILDTHYSYFRNDFLIRKYPEAVILGSESYAGTSDLVKESMEEHTQVIGDFVWTCWDHIGEAGLGRKIHVPEEESAQHDSIMGMLNLMVSAPYPYRTSDCADFDLNGELTIQGCFRKVVWGDRSTYIAVQPPRLHDLAEVGVLGFSWPEEYVSWNYPGEEGKAVKVTVYSGADEVELFLNGNSLGKAQAGKNVRYRAVFDITYDPGTLTAVSYVNGAECSRSSIVTSKEPACIRVLPEQMENRAHVNSLIYVPVEITDLDGRRVPDAKICVEAAVTGEGVLAGFGSAAPSTEENYAAGRFTSYEGRLLAVIRSTGTPGQATLHLQAEGLGPRELKVNFI